MLELEHVLQAAFDLQVAAVGAEFFDPLLFPLELSQSLSQLFLNIGAALATESGPDRQRLRAAGA